MQPRNSSRDPMRLIVCVSVAVVLFMWEMPVAGQLAPRTQPRAPTQRPPIMNVDRLVAGAERVFVEARDQIAASRLRSIERLAATAEASGRIAGLRGQRVWMEAEPLALVERGHVTFTPREKPASPDGPKDAVVSLDLIDILFVSEAGHRIVLQMTQHVADRLDPKSRSYFTGRVVRLRRLGPDRWEVWLRHSRVPEHIDGWPHRWPDYGVSFESDRPARSTTTIPTVREGRERDDD